MSPVRLVRNVPIDEEISATSAGGLIDKDSHEQPRAGAGGSHGAGSKAKFEAGACGRDPAHELPAGEAIVESVSAGWCRRTETRACEPALESGQTGNVSAQGVGFSGEEIFRIGGGALRAHASGGTFGGRRRAGDPCRDLASLDVTSGLMDTTTK